MDEADSAINQVKIIKSRGLCDAHPDRIHLKPKISPELDDGTRNRGICIYV
jgi:hypothetical protein